MMPEKAGGRAQAIVSIESFSPLRPQRIAAMAMQSGVRNTRNMEFHRISVLTLNLTVAKAKPAVINVPIIFFFIKIPVSVCTDLKTADQQDHDQ